VRSHRRGLDWLLVPLGYRPWRCRDCGRRFYARREPLRWLLYARCPQCGTRDLVGLSRRHRDSLPALGRWLGGRAVRCERCRLNFLAWRPLRPVPSPRRHS